MMLPIRLTSLERLDIATVVFWVTQMCHGETQKYDEVVTNKKEGWLVCPLYGNAVSMHRCGFLVTHMYDVSVTLKVE